MRSVYFGHLPAAALAAVTAIGVSTAAFAQNSTVIVAPSAPAAPQAQAVWESGHWQQQPTGGYVWVDGHWRS